jgi:hypothetical protein
LREIKRRVYEIEIFPHTAIWFFPGTARIRAVWPSACRSASAAVGGDSTSTGLREFRTAGKQGTPGGKAASGYTSVSD